MVTCSVPGCRKRPLSRLRDIVFCEGTLHKGSDVAVTHLCYACFNGLLFRGKPNLFFFMLFWLLSAWLIHMWYSQGVLLGVPCLVKCPGDYPVPDVITASWLTATSSSRSCICLLSNGRGVHSWCAWEGLACVLIILRGREATTGICPSLPFSMMRCNTNPFWVSHYKKQLGDTQFGGEAGWSVVFWGMICKWYPMELHGWILQILMVIRSYLKVSYPSQGGPYVQCRSEQKQH